MAQKKLYVPWVEDKNSNMRMLHISHMDDLIANSMNILEPAPVDAQGNEREDGTTLYKLRIISIISPARNDTLFFFLWIVLQAEEPVDLFILPGIEFPCFCSP